MEAVSSEVVVSDDEFEASEVIGVIASLVSGASFEASFEFGPVDQRMRLGLHGRKYNY